MLAVVQFSDLHVVCNGERDYGGLGPDTTETWGVAAGQAFASDIPLPDRVVVTGDVSSHATIEEYRVARERLNSLPAPVNVLLGNHDRQSVAEATLPSQTVSMNGAELHGRWLFIYIDSNSLIHRSDAERENGRPPRAGRRARRDLDHRDGKS